MIVIKKVLANMVKIMNIAFRIKNFKTFLTLFFFGKKFAVHYYKVKEEIEMALYRVVT